MGGYNDLEERLFMFFTPKRKNCLQFESSIYESKVTGIRAMLKRIVFKRFSVALPSGKLQTSVFEALGYAGKIIETKGVGLFNKPSESKTNKQPTLGELEYLFVGRLIPVKNLEFLIHVFNQTKKSLTIVGLGILENHLKEQANSNIQFTGFIPNEKIYELYCSHDIFVLPSISEPWGLVIEEAIYFGLPVLASDKVGCQEEMIIQPNTGIVFQPTSESSLLNAIAKLEANIDLYRRNCSEFNFEQRDKQQVKAYLRILSL